MPAFVKKTSILAAASALALTSCMGAFDPANPGQVTQSERQQGAEAHPQIMAQFGGAYNGPGTAMVQRVGKQIAMQSGITQTGDDCTATLLNTPVVNAFAIPGCYIYVTRGLLSIMEDEAELASVIGHEIGHVAADHGKRRQNAGLFAGLASIATAILTGSGQLGQLAGQLGQVATLKYSRDQEFQSDDLGIRYMTQAGYDPYASADMLESLGDQSSFEARLRGRAEAAQIPAWARTHPLSTDRVRRANSKAQQTGLQPGQGERDAAAFMNAVDGMLYGDAPEQGFVEGHKFAHPTLRLAFEVPNGYYLNNSTAAVTGTSGNSRTQIQFSGGRLASGQSLDSYISQVYQGLLGNARNQAQFGGVRNMTINGMPAASAEARVRTQQGAVDATVVAYRFDADSAYHFIFLSPSNVDDGRIVQSTANSFRKISSAEAARLRPRKIDVVTVQSGDTVARLASRMAFDDFKVERFRVINDLDEGDTLRAGQRVKLVVYG